MIAVYYHNNKPRLDWACYSPLFCEEIFRAGNRGVDVSLLIEKIKEVNDAHERKLAHRHAVEEAFIDFLIAKEITQVICKREETNV